MSMSSGMSGMSELPKGMMAFNEELVPVPEFENLSDKNFTKEVKDVLESLPFPFEILECHTVEKYSEPTQITVTIAVMSAK